MIENLTPVQQRLFDFLPDTPRWGFKKQANYTAKKEDILFTANYIQLPTHKKKYIALDLDYELAGAAWMNDILPEPTVTIINRENEHDGATVVRRDQPFRQLRSTHPSENLVLSPAEDLWGLLGVAGKTLKP